VLSALRGSNAIFYSVTAALTEGTQRVHDEVDPQQLQHVQRRLAGADGGDESHHQRHEVDGELQWYRSKTSVWRQGEEQRQRATKQRPEEPCS